MALKLVYTAAVMECGEPRVDTFEIPITIGKDLDAHLADHIGENCPGVTLLKVVSVRIEHTCVGCQYDEPGQLAHMEEGGCLHQKRARGSDSQ